MLLMVWASLAGAREIDENKHPPCQFSPLCTCSKPSVNDLGIVQCKNVPYPAIPKTVNNSKVCFNGSDLLVLSHDFLCHLSFDCLNNRCLSYIWNVQDYEI